MIRAGELTERLIVVRDVETTDTQGGRSTTPQTVTTIWAKPETLGAMERMQAESIGSQSRHRFTVRQTARVTARQRLTWTPRGLAGLSPIALEVLGVQPGPDRASLVLECVAVL